MGADPPRLAAIERSRDSGDALSSGRRIFVDGGGEHVGLAMRLPVYHRGMPLNTVEQRRLAYMGSVGAGIRINDMLSGLLSEQTLRVIKFKIYDAGGLRSPAVPPSADTLLFDSVAGVSVAAPAKTAFAAASGAGPSIAQRMPYARNARVAADNANLFRRVEQSFGGRRWQIEFVADPAALSASPRFLPDLALLAGSIISA